MTSKPIKRVLSALLALCMLFGMWSPGLTVYAEEQPAVAFDFQNDTLDTAPKYVVQEVTGGSTVTVVADPDTAAPNNKVMKLNDPKSSNCSARADIEFEDQAGTFTVALKLRVSAEGQYNINLYGNDDTLGPRFMLRGGKFEYKNGSSWTVYDTHDVNTWYNIKIVSDVTEKTYSVYVNDTEVAKDAAFEVTSMTALNMLSITTTISTVGALYADDIAVPNPIKNGPYTPAYKEEQLLADGSSSTYLAFPTILKLSNEKVLIAYKATTAHKDVEADLDLIVFNPTTKEMISKTTIDGTVGEAAQNPELMQMPNGDLVIYLDVQCVDPNEPQTRYGIKEIRSTDGGETWNVRAADNTYKPVDQVAKHQYMKLTDDQGIVYGYTFDDVTVDGIVYMLAMSFTDFAADPGRSVHIIKSSDYGATWTHVKNLNDTFGINFNESTLESYNGGFIVNCRRDSDGNEKSVSYLTDENFNVLQRVDHEDIIKTVHRPKLFIENGKYYLMGRNKLSDTTTLYLYEIDPETLVPLNFIELNDLPGHTYYHSFYAEYYLQEENDVTYFNVITYDDSRAKGHPDIVRYEYIWEELITQTPVTLPEDPVVPDEPDKPEKPTTPEWATDAVSVKNITMNSADIVFKAPSDDEFVTDYTITLNGTTAGTIGFEEIKEVSGTLAGAQTNHSGQGTYYIAMPKNIPEGMKLPVVIAVHGSSRGAMDYKNTAFYAEQKNIALANGYIFAAISNESDTWGLDDGLYNINLFYDYLIANYPVQEKAALWATSAGGTLANRMVKDYPAKVSFVLGTFPVYDLISGFNNVNSCKTAWGTSDLETFKTKIEGKNPADFSNALKNHDYYIAHGSADVAVPITENSQKMVTDVGSNVHLEVIEGGVHGTSNYAFYGDIIDQAFEEHPAIYTYALTGLTADTDYTVSITAFDADNNSAVSNTASFKTLAEGGGPEEPDEPDEPVVSGDGYTASLICSDTDLNVGQQLTVNVAVNGTEADKFASGEVIITYDSTRLTFNKTASSLGKATVPEQVNGTIKLEDYGETKDFGNAYILVFDTKAEGDANVTLTSAKFSTYANAASDDLVEATLSNATVTAKLTQVYSVTLPDGFTGNASVKKGDNYTFTADDTSNYTYKVTATMGGKSVDVIENTDGSYTISDVTGVLDIDAEFIPNSYAVTFAGNGAEDVEVKPEIATYGQAFTFTMPSKTGFAYSVAITYTGTENTVTYSTDDNGVVTIAGDKITGAITITITKTQTDANMSVSGSGAGDVTLPSQATPGTDLVFTVNKDIRYNYEVTATVNGEIVILTPGENGQYTLDGDDFEEGDDIVINIVKTVKADNVAVSEYVTVDQSQMWLITFTTTKMADSTYTYNENKMYWSEEYGAYCYLVVATVKPTVTADDLAIVTGAATEVNYGMDVNMTNVVDANDAQLVYNMYKPYYANFTDDVTMEKFLRADVNFDGKIDMSDPQVIIDSLLS